MPVGLEIGLIPEQLSEGTDEERACFGLFTMRCNELNLTAGIDSFISTSRPGPLVSGYHAAEWFAWNWWRLRFEPKTPAKDWWRAHKMTAIGEGYSWPNLTIWSDGVRTMLLSDPSLGPNARAFHYLGAPPCVIPSTEFEQALDAFVPQIIDNLKQKQIFGSNLARLWDELSTERNNKELASRRRLEALMGKEPGEASDEIINRLIDEANSFGEQAIQELAADVPYMGELPSATNLQHLADSFGYEFSARNAVNLPADTLSSSSKEPAWLLGAKAAQALRQQQGLGEKLLTNKQLADFTGVQERALDDASTASNMSFALNKSPKTGHLVLSSKWATGRRFALARLLAERLVDKQGAGLHVATRAYTYRQQLQRSFAAEFLSPFKAVDAMLNGDYSPDKQTEVARHFQVSDLTIQTLLINHRKIPREPPDEDRTIPIAA